MRRRTKIIATVGRQREKTDETCTSELGDFEEGKIPHGQLLRHFIDAGVDVIRINMSFASKQQPYGVDEEQYLRWLNSHRNVLPRPIAVLGDLPGSKVRLGRVLKGDEKFLKRGMALYLGFGSKVPENKPAAMVLVNDRPFNESVHRVADANSISEYIDRRPRTPIQLSIGDGKVELQTRGVIGNDVIACEVMTEVVRQGEFREGRGLTLKHVPLTVNGFPDADQKALDFLLEHGDELLGFVAVSFVQSKDDILHVRHYIEGNERIKRYAACARSKNGRATERVLAPGIIAKIETREAWDKIDDILDVADGIMVARGDLGEQLPPEEVPHIQKELIKKCNVRGKPVITATQMLDSMEKNPAPTRAEAADVFNAILDGSDAVMLSGETSVGSYPIQSIRRMSDIVEMAEEYYYLPAHRRKSEQILEEARQEVPTITKRLEDARESALNASGFGVDRKLMLWVAQVYEEKIERSRRQPTTDRICEAACGLAEAGKYGLGVEGEFADGEDIGGYKGILVSTASGRTAFMISRFRPRVRILGAAHYERTFRKLVFGYGIHPIHVDTLHEGAGEFIEDAVRIARAEKLVAAGEELVVTSGARLYIPGTTDRVQIHRVANDVGRPAER